MRPSPPPSKRHLQAIEVTQFELPYATAPGNSALANTADNEVHLNMVRPEREIRAMQCNTLQEPAAANKHRQRKKKLPAKVTVPPDAKLLVGREEAAVRLSLSVRSIDYLLADRQLKFRRIGGRVLIPISELERFAKMDHPERIAS